MSTDKNKLLTGNIPRHIAVIMDGNGRWAKKKLLPRIAGHKQGVTSVRDTVKKSSELGVKALTLFAFSSENKKRPKEEVLALFSLFLTALKNEVKKLDKANIKLKIIGDVSIFNEKIQQKIIESEKILAKNTGLTLVIAVNYGGKWDITQAIKKIASLVESKQISIDDINEDLLANYVCLSELPDVDLLIRTSGEKRISNFLLWQCAYSELYFTNVLWPDFNTDELDKAIVSFQKRKRRFGIR